MSPGNSKPFRFKQFEVVQSRSSMKVGTDAVLLGAWANVQLSGSGRLLDVGAGTGVIALICAQRCPACRVEAIEIHPGSAEDCAENFTRSPWGDRMTLIQGDFLQLNNGRHYQIIISNPPYFSDSLRASDPGRSAARHDDTLPSDKFMMHSAELLEPEGRVCVIIPTNQLERWVSSARAAGFTAERICHVYTLAYKEPPRVMLEFRRGEIAEPIMESILIEKSPGEFSEAYKALTHEFYTRW